MTVSQWLRAGVREKGCGKRGLTPGDANPAERLFGPADRD